MSKSRLITLHLDRAQLKLELCEASVSRYASGKLRSKRDGRGPVTSDSVRRGLFRFKLSEMGLLDLCQAVSACAYLGVRPLRDYKITRAALHFRLFSSELVFGLC